MSFLFACLLTLPSCSDVSQALGPTDPVAAVTVRIDSTTLLVGHVAQVSITAVDSAGNSVVVSSVSWVSMTPDIATVDSLGAVTAMGTGDALIEGKVGGSIGHVQVAVRAAPDLAQNDFNTGSLGPFTNPWNVGLDFPTDPTGSDRGRVARFHYVAAGADQNRAMDFAYPRRWGEPMYFKGDFFIPVADLAADNIIRKLVYWQSHSDWAKYTNGGLATGRTVVHLEGSDLVVDATYNPAPSTGKTSDDVRTVATIATGLHGNEWYTIEVYQRMETAVGRADGVLQIWLKGESIFSNTHMTWSDPAWIGNTSGGVPFSGDDIYFEHFLVGDQVMSFSSYDEYRYWDNVAFSTRRIGG